MIMRKSATFLAYVALAVPLAPSAAFAQTAAETTQQEIDRLKLQVDLATQRVALASQQAALNKQEVDNIKALGLPAFENKTAIASGGGEIETTIMGMHALGGAVTTIYDSLDPNRTYLVLAGDETVNLSLAASIQAQMGALNNAFKEAETEYQKAKKAATANGRRGGATVEFLSVGVAPVIALVSAFAGLLGSDSSVSSVALGAISNRMLASALAARLKERGYLSTTPVAIELTLKEGPSAWADKSFLERFNTLAKLNGDARLHRAELGDKPEGTAKAAAVALDQVIALYAAFHASVTTPNDTGAVPLVTAARLAALLATNPLVLRVAIDSARGGIITTKNLWTTFGADPVRISGGLAVSYLVTDPKTGATVGGNSMSCTTALTSLRRVQAGTWRESLNGKAIRPCEPLF
ncbi:MAG: hypothetical protein V4574_07300 [Pseudomonadota bacterium]